jgi:hypothetical protein
MRHPATASGDALTQGKRQEAIEQYREAVRHNPDQVTHTTCIALAAEGALPRLRNNRRNYPSATKRDRAHQPVEMLARDAFSV